MTLNYGAGMGFNTFKQANVSNITDYTPPSVQVRTASDLDALKSRDEANLLFLFLVPIASVMRTKNSEIREILKRTGFDSGSVLQIFIKYTEKAAYYKTKQIN